MPFKEILETTQTFPDVPFLNDWKSKKKNDGTIFTVHTIFQSDKGLVLSTSEFKVFIWKSEALFTSILEKIGASLQPNGTFESLAVKPIAATKKGFSLGWDDSVTGFYVEDGRVIAFTPSDTALSSSPMELELDGDVIDTSPKNGRKAR